MFGNLEDKDGLEELEELQKALDQLVDQIVMVEHFSTYNDAILKIEDVYDDHEQETIAEFVGLMCASLEKQDVDPEKINDALHDALDHEQKHRDEEN